jgi:Bacterial Ig-like domain (group 3)
MRSLILVVLVALPGRAPADVLTQHNDLARTGATLSETLLTPRNVDGRRFGKLFARTVNGELYAQPLYMAAVPLSSGTRNLVFLASMHNVVYAFDADDPATSAPLWTATLEPPVPLPDANIGSACGTYRDIAVEIGILSTPVIDAARQLLYVVTFSTDGSSYSHHLHALSVLDGSEQLAGPVALAASVPGSGDGSVAGSVAFQSRYENQRAALSLSNDTIYIAFASYCDSGPYHGWVLAYDASNLSQSAAYNATADGSEGGIWQSGEGLSADASGNIYLSVGNGSFDFNTGGIDLGEGFTRLSASLQVQDWFVPFDYVTLNQRDLDLGSTGLLLVPGSTQVIGGGKSGVLYVADGSNLGHLHASDNNQITQFFQLTPSGGIYGSPVYWSGPSGPTVYVWGVNDALKAFHFDGTKLVTPPAAQNAVEAPKQPGGILSVSANGVSDGVLWSNMSTGASANQQVVPGVLRAFNAADVSQQLWTSQDQPARDSSGSFAKFCAPTVAAGKVYLSTFSNQMVAYGLLPAGLPLSASPSPAALGQTVTLTATVLAPSPGMPAGEVQFFDGASPLGNSTLDGAGQARWSGSLAVGAHTLGASFPGDGNFPAVSASPLPELVTAGASATTLSSSANPAPPGSSLTLSAHVTGPAAPTGTITFKDGTTVLGTTMLDDSGTATLEVMLPQGTHALGADYSGDSNLLGSTATLAQVVEGAPVTLAASPTPSPARFGDSVRVDVSASSAGGTPSGTVTLLDGATALGQAALDGNGRAAILFVAGAPADYTLTVQYSGDAARSPASLPLALTVTRALSRASLVASAAGDHFLLLASISGGAAGTPTGSVRFLDGSSALGTAQLDASGVAAWSGALPAGAHTLTAAYDGDADFLGAQSAPIDVTASPAAPDDAGPTATPDLAGGGLSPSGGCSCDATGGGADSPPWLLFSLLAIIRFHAHPLARRHARRARRRARD